MHQGAPTPVRSSHRSQHFPGALLFCASLLRPQSLCRPRDALRRAHASHGRAIFSDKRERTDAVPRLQHCRLRIMFANSIVAVAVAVFLVLCASGETLSGGEICGAGTIRAGTHCPMPISYKNLPGNTFDSCCKACQADSTCVAFVLAGSTCHLKNSPPMSCSPEQDSIAVTG